MKNVCIFLAVFSLGFIFKGLFSYFGIRFASYPSVTRMLSAAPYGDVDELNAIANNSTLPLKRRAEAIYGLFAYHVSCGMDANGVKSILGSCQWLKESSVFRQAVLGGQVPVDISNGSLVVIQLFNVSPEFGLWKIYLSLEGEGGEADARRFFEGASDEAKFIRISEFALTFPHPYQANAKGRTERYTRWRVAVRGRAP